MGKSWLLCALLATMARGQAAPPNAPTTPPAPVDTSASVPANAPVLTIEGVCAPQPKPAAAKGATAKPASEKTSASKSSAECKTVITKAQFEQLANNLAPNITPQMKKQLASVLPRLMAMADDARKQGLDKTPQYQERVKFRTMQVLAEALQQKIQEEAAKVPDADIEKYYKEHPEDFEQYSLDRIFVPRTKQEAELKTEPGMNEKLTEDEQKAKEAADKAKEEEGQQAMTKLADDLRTRAAAGEDIIKLQKEAFEAAGMKIESPTVNLPSVRRTALSPAHAAVFDLKLGEVSPVISDAGGHYIYKLNSKTEVPLEQAKGEIRSRLQNERMRESMDKLNSSFKVETNEAYFGPGGPGAMPPRPGHPNMPGMRPGTPPAGATSPAPTPPADQPPATKPN
jgi:peptidyl-prolyl cis-trans isomerase C